MESRTVDGNGDGRGGGRTSSGSHVEKPFEGYYNQNENIGEMEDRRTWERGVESGCMCTGRGSTGGMAKVSSGLCVLLATPYLSPSNSNNHVHEAKDRKDAHKPPVSTWDTDTGRSCLRNHVLPGNRPNQPSITQSRNWHQRRRDCRHF